MALEEGHLIRREASTIAACRSSCVRSRRIASTAMARQTRPLKAETTQKFPRAKLADGGTRFGPGQPVVTPSIYEVEIVAQYQQMEFAGRARICRRCTGCPC